MSELGKLLRRLRGKESLRDAARRANMSHTYLSVIEKGKDLRSGNEVKPTPETLKLLSIAYNHPYEDLMNKAGYLTGLENLYEAWANRKPTKQDQLNSIDRYIKEATENHGDPVEAKRMELIKEILYGVVDLPQEDQERINDFVERLKK